MNSNNDWYREAINKYDLKSISFENFGKKKRIGRGGFGNVYSTTCSSIPGKIALKEISVDIGDVQKNIKNFLNELKLHSKTDHDRIIKFFGVSYDEENELYFLVLEFAENDMRTYLSTKKNTLQWAEKVRLAIQIAEGMQYIHNELNVAHRDLIRNKNIKLNHLKDSSYDKKITKRTLIKNSDLIKEIILDQSTYPTSKKITGEFVLLKCGHFIRQDAFNEWKIESQLKDETFECLFCSEKVDPNSNLCIRQDVILKGICQKLVQEGYLDCLMNDQDDYIFIKIKKSQICNMSKTFQITTSMPILHRVRPKIMIPDFNKAVKAEQQSQFKDEIDCLTRILRYYPKSYSIRCRRAYASWKLKKYAKALEDLKCTIQLKPLKTLAYIYKSQIHQLFGENDKALSDLDKVLEIDPKNAIALLYKAKILVFGFGNSLPVQLYIMDNDTIFGYILYKLKDTNRAITYCNSAIKNNEKN
ncbi:16221_t:CDS:2, partial [Gigaspora margarita]